MPSDRYAVANRICFGASLVVSNGMPVVVNPEVYSSRLEVTHSQLPLPPSILTLT